MSLALIQTLRYVAGHPLNAHDRFGAIARFLRWQVASRVYPGEYIHEWIGGAQFRVRRGLTGLTGNMYAGLHEFEDMAFLLHYLRPDDYFVDVGANVGAYSLLAGAVVGARGVALEPVLSSFARLTENLRLNHCEQRVACLNIAAGDAAGQLRISTDQDTLNHVLSGDRAVGGGEEVEVRRIENVVSELPLLMKIDVEGYETPVIDGAMGVLSGEHPQALILELNGCGHRYGYSEEALFARLIKMGFTSCTYAPLRRELRATLGRNTEGNTLLVRGLDFARERIAGAPKLAVHGCAL